MFNKSGKYELHLAEFDCKYDYYTFSPNLLCELRRINIDDEMVFLLTKAHRLLGMLEGVQHFIPNIDVIESFR